MKLKRLQPPSNLNSLVMIGFFSALTFLAASAESIQGAGLREWKSGDGKYSVKASLISLNTATNKVTLKKEDSKTVEVPLSQLSTADQSFVKENAPVSKESQKLGEQIKLHGINWQPEIEEALKLASGQGAADNRPVMWFRVLGKLDDGM